VKLEGIRVLDLSSFLPGPYLTLAMADHGSEVIKVEAPGGDHGRQIGITQEGATVFFRNVNRGKKSVVLNLKDEADRKTFLRLAQGADVIVESSRPGVAARLGIDYATLSALNPRIIYCSISAFGQDGPLAGRPAHDLAIEAMTGVLSTNLGRDGQTALPAIPASDYLAGLQGLAGVLMALYRRETTGRGDFIDISMQEAMLAGALNVLGPAIAEGRQQDPLHERTTGGAAFYRCYATADGREIALAGQEPKFINALLGKIGRMDLADLCKAPGPHQQPVMAVLEELFAGMTLSEASTLLTSLGLCWAPVKTFPEALEDEQLLARNFIVREPGGVRHIGSPIRFASEPAQLNLAVPALDEHGTGIRQKTGN
jgi:crotonobetainyl-CoA:carnitine CoA-transferase CaiB-like acyl-CoA transferase